MNKIIILLFVLLVSCGVQEREDFIDYPPEEPTCWTVDGDSELYFYVLPTHAVEQEFYDHCQKMREESFGR